MSDEREEIMTPRKKIAYVQAAWHADITDRCNVACYFCNQQDVRTSQQISLPHLVRLIDELGLRRRHHAEIGDVASHDRRLRPDHGDARGGAD